MAINVELNSGRIIQCQNYNGTFYITNEKISAEDFSRGELIHVTVSGSIQDENGSPVNISETFSPAKLAAIHTDNNGSTFFALYQPPAEIIRQNELNAKIQYIAMMSDVDLEA